MILVFHTAVHTAENYYRMGAWVHSVFFPFLVLFIWLEKSEPLKRAFSPNNNRRSFHSVQKVCVTHMMRPTGFEPLKLENSACSPLTEKHDIGSCDELPYRTRIQSVKAL